MIIDMVTLYPKTSRTCAILHPLGRKVHVLVVMLPAGLTTPVFGVCAGWAGASGMGMSEKSSCATALIVKASA